MRKLLSASGTPTGYLNVAHAIADVALIQRSWVTWCRLSAWAQWQIIQASPVKALIAHSVRRLIVPSAAVFVVSDALDSQLPAAAIIVGLMDGRSLRSTVMFFSRQIGQN